MVPVPAVDVGSDESSGQVAVVTPRESNRDAEGEDRSSDFEQGGNSVGSEGRRSGGGRQPLRAAIGSRGKAQDYRYGGLTVSIMSRFAINNPYFIVVICLIIGVVGVSSLSRMPIDMFPAMNIPVVVVATFYSGMPPEQIETDITSRFERFFKLGSGIDHIESRSLPGVSIIKVYFQSNTNPDSDVTTISNLAMAQLRRLPPGTLPPVVLKFDASSLPVCLVTFKGEGLDETHLRDLAQFQVRNQIAERAGRERAAAVRRQVPADHGVHRSLQARSAPAELDGCGAHAQSWRI